MNVAAILIKMETYAILHIYFLLICMTQFVTPANVSVDQHPYDLKVLKTTEIKFTCKIMSDSNFTAFVEKNHIILAEVPDKGSNSVKITGEPSCFTVTVDRKENETYTGLYYCVARTTAHGDIHGNGTHVYSGGPSFGTRTGLVFAIIFAGVGMINILL